MSGMFNKSRLHFLIIRAFTRRNRHGTMKIHAQTSAIRAGLLCGAGPAGLVHAGQRRFLRERQSWSRCARRSAFFWAG